ncbi:hypothetical protein DAEQUDRAFT_374308 [Daedalea quercina L-15889]|uniref:Uncharacterized protein n=1 Tax=Daedalea quercina L-15889 TaxID=1314783 RepID=A0A165P6X8_9APHY|nr:hypothetical protein DAEQUDRAFT_374308 [Daedalea quercina L-15889]
MCFVTLRGASKYSQQMLRMNGSFSVSVTVIITAAAGHHPFKSLTHSAMVRDTSGPLMRATDDATVHPPKQLHLCSV